MGKKANAANITHGLAQLGGGSKKEGGDGMIGGLKKVFQAGGDYERQKQLGNEPSTLLTGQDESES